MVQEVSDYLSGPKKDILVIGFTPGICSEHYPTRKLARADALSTLNQEDGARFKESRMLHASGHSFVPHLGKNVTFTRVNTLPYRH
jgi:hypothetical protein